ncbi:MAG: hypothetical protein ACLFQY_06755, partial [Desulfococcaceae bacterium]
VLRWKENTSTNISMLMITAIPTVMNIPTTPRRILTSIPIATPMSIFTNTYTNILMTMRRRMFMTTATPAITALTTIIIRVMSWKPMTTNIDKIRKHGGSFSGKYPEAVPTLKRGH